MTGRQKLVKSTRDIFFVPLLIGMVSAAGLASALLGDGIWDALSWLTLGVPVAVTLFFSIGKRRQR
jgi:hypothetical protein